MLTSTAMGLLLASGALGVDELTSVNTSQLVVFVAPEASKLARDFQHRHLPVIRKIASELSIPVRIVDIANGAPPEVAITPLLVYQDHRGRSIYQGRFTNTGRIRNFLRTARVVLQGDKRLTRIHTAVWQAGRAQIAASLKVATVTGRPAANYEHEPFVTEMRKAILAGFRKFHGAQSISLRRSDRLFYMDFNPWLSDDGTLFLSVVLFSQFHCTEPIFTRPGETFTAPWRNRTRLFRRAAAALETAVVEAVRSSPHGDGFDPIPKSVPAVTWGSLGLVLPPRPIGGPKESDGPSLGRSWTVVSRGTGARPQLVFHFPAPLDGFVGEVGSVRGELHFGPDLAADSVRGYFVGDPKTVTMGDPDLDHAIHGSLFLAVTSHPTSEYVIESVSAPPSSLSFGDPIPATLQGVFTLKGISIPLSVRTFFEPIVDKDGKAALVMTGGFELSLVPFRIEGPDGPSPAKETLVLDFHLHLRPLPLPD